MPVRRDKARRGAGTTRRWEGGSCLRPACRRDRTFIVISVITPSAPSEVAPAAKTSGLTDAEHAITSPLASTRRKPATSAEKLLSVRPVPCVPVPTTPPTVWRSMSPMFFRPRPRACSLRAGLPQRRRRGQGGRLAFRVGGLQSGEGGQVDQRAVARVQRREGMPCPRRSHRAVGLADGRGEFDFVLGETRSCGACRSRRPTSWTICRRRFSSVRCSRIRFVPGLISRRRRARQSCNFRRFRTARLARDHAVSAWPPAARARRASRRTGAAGT